MAKTLLHRVFGAGKLPDAVRATVRDERTLYAAEGIRVSLRRNGHVPGATRTGNVRLAVGGFVVTDRRVIGYRGGGILVHVPFDVADGGPATLTLDATGLHVYFDLDRVDASCRGEIRLDFRDDVPPDALASFPVTDRSFPVDPQKVVRLFGSRTALPT